MSTQGQEGVLRNKRLIDGNPCTPHHRSSAPVPLIGSDVTAAPPAARCAPPTRQPSQTPRATRAQSCPLVTRTSR